MANLEIDKREFQELVGENFEDQKLKEKASYLGAHWHRIEGNVCEVETYPNRPDLLSVEGLARAYRGFFGIDTGLERYHVNDGDIELEVDKSVEEVRPVIGGAVVRSLDLDKKIINGLIQLQEKMHETMGRKRDKLAIGLHDLSKVKPPFEYKAVEPEQVSFTPLEYDREMQLGEILDEHEKGVEYSWILEDEEQYPVIVDSEDRVLSFPPIINNQLTEVGSGTTNVFIDVTGKDRQTVMKALNILVTALEERGGIIESVNVDGEEMPDLTPESMELDPDYFREISGLDLSKTEIMERLKQMKYGAKGGDKIKVEIPCYRTDIMHQYDLIEDVVIAHGYQDVEPELPEVDQVAEQQEVESFKDLIREVMVGTGALETNTYYLTNKRDLFERMDLEKKPVIEMSNPLTEDYTVVRNWLLPSLMQVLEQNRHQSYPQKLFEASEVAVLNDSNTGSSNRNKLAYLEASEETDFNDAREVLQVLERDLGVEFEVEQGQKNCFREGRSAKISLEGEKIGFIGEMSEEVVEEWNLEATVAGFEIDLEILKELR